MRTADKVALCLVTPMYVAYCAAMVLLVLKAIAEMMRIF